MIQELHDLTFAPVAPPAIILFREKRQSRADAVAVHDLAGEGRIIDGIDEAQATLVALQPGQRPWHLPIAAPQHAVGAHDD